MSLMVAALQFLLVAAGAFVVLAAVTSYLRYEQLIKATKEESADEHGLSEEALFLLHVAQRLAVGSRATEPFCVMAAAPGGAGAVPDGRLDAMAARARAVLRAGDEVRVIENRTVAVLADLPPHAAPVVAERLLAAWRSPEVLKDATSAPRIQLGLALFPGAGESAAGLLALAEAARDAAARDAAGPGWHAADPIPKPPAEESDEEPSRLVDPLTGVLRAEKLGVAVRKFMARGRRAEQSVSLLCIDLCRLEEINMRNGRETGDAVLKSVAASIEESVRLTDLIGRVEDDEFLVVLECGADAARAVGERVIDRVRAVSVAAASGAVRPSVNVAVVEYPLHGRTLPGLIERGAVTLASLAKVRNTCRVYEPGMERRHRRHRAARGGGTAQDDVF